MKKVHTKGISIAVAAVLMAGAVLCLSAPVAEARGKTPGAAASKDLEINCNPREIADTLRQALSDVDGIKIRMAGELVIIEGEVLTTEAFHKVTDIAGRFPSILNWVKVSEATESALAENVTALINLPTVNVAVIGDRFVVEGSVGSEDELLRVNKIVNSYFDSGENSGRLVNMIKVKVSKVLVECKVQLVEVDENVDKDIGFEYGASAGGSPYDASVKTVASSFIYNVSRFFRQQTQTGSLDPLNKQLTGSKTPEKVTFGLNGTFRFSNALRNARVIAEPKLITLSGSQATSNFGGQFPITTDRTIEWKNYGITLKLTPVVEAGGGSISTKLFAESSELGKPVKGYPSLVRATTSADLTVKEGETIVISGLIRDYEAVERQKIPLVGDLPLVGNIFTRRHKVTERKKILLFITPRIVNTFDLSDRYAVFGDGDTSDKFIKSLGHHQDARTSTTIGHLEAVAPAGEAVPSKIENPETTIRNATIRETTARDQIDSEAAKVTKIKNRLAELETKYLKK